MRLSTIYLCQIIIFACAIQTLEVGKVRAQIINRPCCEEHCGHPLPPICGPGGDNADDPSGAWTYTRTPGGINVSGYAEDPDTTDAIQIQIFQKKGNTITPITTLLANAPTHNGHSFTGLIPVVEPNENICAIAKNVGDGKDKPLKPSCYVPATNPFGSIETITMNPDGLHVSGWVIDPDTADSMPLTIEYADTAINITSIADHQRPDIGSANPGYGDAHGFEFVVPANGDGLHTVCVRTVNVGSGSPEDYSLGCKYIVRVASLNLYNPGLQHLDEASRNAALVHYGRDLMALADIGLLQEVADNEYTKIIALSAGMNSYTSMVNSSEDLSDTAIISRYPISDASDTVGIRAGRFLAANVNVEGVNHRVIVSHYPRHAKWEVKDPTEPQDPMVARFLLSQQIIGASKLVNDPIFVGGDLNAEPSLPEIGILQYAFWDSFQRISGAEHCSNIRIDYIFYRGPYRPNTYQTCGFDAEPSDHPFVLTTFWRDAAVPPVAPSESSANMSVHSWINSFGTPLVRFKGDLHDWQSDIVVASQDMGKALDGLSLTVVTGDDNLRGGADNVNLILAMTNGGPITLSNVNQSNEWKQGQLNSINLRDMLPPDIKVGDIKGFTINTNFGGGLSGDNWDVESVLLQAVY